MTKRRKKKRLKKQAAEAGPIPLTAQRRAEIDALDRRLCVGGTIIMCVMVIVPTLILSAIGGGIWWLFFCTHEGHRTVLTNNTGTVVTVGYSIPKRYKPAGVAEFPIAPGGKGEVPHLLKRDLLICFNGNRCGMYHSNGIPGRYMFQRDQFGPDLRKTVHMTIEVDRCLYLVPVGAPRGHRAAEQPGGFPICRRPLSAPDHFY